MKKVTLKVPSRKTDARNYCISSTFFETEEQAIAQLRKWNEDSTLDEEARVVKVEQILRPIVDVKVVIEKI